MLAKCAGIYTQGDMYVYSLKVENLALRPKTTETVYDIIVWYSVSFDAANGSSEPAKGSSIVAIAPFVNAKRSFVNAKGSSKVAKENFVNAIASFVNANENPEVANASFISAKRNLVTDNKSFEVDIGSSINDKKMM